MKNVVDIPKITEERLEITEYTVDEVQDLSDNLEDVLQYGENQTNK